MNGMLMKFGLVTSLLGLSLHANYAPMPPEPEPEVEQLTESEVEKEAIVKRGETAVDIFQGAIDIFNTGEKAGDFFKDPAIHVNYDYSDIQDSLIGSEGHSHTATFSLTGSVGDSSIVALSYTRDRYNLLSATVGSSYLQETDVYSLFWGFNLDENWLVGTYGSYSQIEAGSGSPGDGGNVDRLGAGLLVAYHTDLDERVNLGLYTSLTSLNKRSLERLFNNEDTVIISGADLHFKVSDEFSVSPYASMTAFLDKEAGDPDGYYGKVGLDVDWTPSESWELSAGYASVVEDDSRDEDTISGRVSYYF